jgi:hypothetical protein
MELFNCKARMPKVSRLTLSHTKFQQNSLQNSLDNLRSQPLAILMTF